MVIKMEDFCVVPSSFFKGVSRSCPIVRRGNSGCLEVIGSLFLFLIVLSLFVTLFEIVNEEGVCFSQCPFLRNSKKEKCPLRDENGKFPAKIFEIDVLESLKEYDIKKMIQEQIKEQMKEQMKDFKECKCCEKVEEDHDDGDHDDGDDPENK